MRFISIAILVLLCVAFVAPRPSSSERERGNLVKAGLLRSIPATEKQCPGPMCAVGCCPYENYVCCDMESYCAESQDQC